ncbi:hypothetical protein [Streptomyces hokutonensis]|uniref:hypothetical protein n=1 Tax=Streptomyces hokutonensis TaxID=1306990 RepID=UPI00037CC278|nr:hypothetical protein [Streptomyces hokutonensis]
MTMDTPDLDEYRAIHERDVADYRAGLEDLRVTLASAFRSVEELAQTLAGLPAVAEDGQRRLQTQGSSIDEYAKGRGETGVTTPRVLDEFLASLTDRERRLYDEARLGPAQAARALSRLAALSTPPDPFTALS